MTSLTELAGLRPESRTTGSMLRSLIGLHLRDLGGWIAVSSLMSLMADAGSTSTGIRSALSRLKSKGLLEPEKRFDRAGYRISAASSRMLARGDRRIYGYRQMRSGDPWMLVIFSIPEEVRQLRHQLRSELQWLGFGVLTGGTWIAPGHLLAETKEVLADVGLLDYVTLVRTQDPEPPEPLARAVLRWWDFDALDELYAQFLDAHRGTLQRWADSGGTDQRAFVEHLQLVDDWRGIPYLDPALPAALLPPNYRGSEGVALFGELRRALAPAADRHVRATVART